MGEGMKKGDVVKVKAYVTTDYAEEGDEIIHSPSGNPFSESVKSLIQWRCPTFIGIVTGFSFRSTGHYHPGKSGGIGHIYDIMEYDPPELNEDKRHKVWMVQPFSYGDNRWYKPLACLEENLELINDA